MGEVYRARDLENADGVQALVMELVEGPPAFADAQGAPDPEHTVVVLQNFFDKVRRRVPVDR